MTFKTIINASESLARLSNEKLAVKEAVKLARVIQNVSGEVEIFNDCRRKLLEEYGSFNSEKETYEFDKESGNAFNEKMIELLNTETEAKIEKVKISGDISLSAADVIKLEEFANFE